MHKVNLIPFLILFILVGCKDQKEKEISKIKLQYDFIAFHRAFYSADKTGLISLKKSYPYLFPSDVSNNEWLAKIEDSNEKILFKITDSVFKNLSNIEHHTYKLYQHIKYYKPSFTPPKTLLLINGLDYENAVIYADSLAFISLDLYLGANSDVYADFPEYLSSNFTENNITVDLAKEIIQREFPIYRDRSLLGSMLYYGKKLYITEQLIPKVKENILLGFSKSKLQWSRENETQIWMYFMRNELLFSTDPSLNKRFIDIAPFSKFYLDSDRESPGSIGSYIGLQIIRSYMEYNDVSLDKMIATDTDEIFKNSRYKPSK